MREVFYSRYPATFLTAFFRPLGSHKQPYILWFPYFILPEMVYYALQWQLDRLSFPQP